jgi:hypothetical protein
MSRLQIRLFGPYFSSFLLYSYGYGAANVLKSVLKHPNFRFGPYSPTVSWSGILIVHWFSSGNGPFPQSLRQSADLIVLYKELPGFAY